jgi:hypothetical protein
VERLSAFEKLTRALMSSSESKAENMPGKKAKAGGKRSWTPEQMDAALSAFWQQKNEGKEPKIAEIAASFGVPRRTLSGHLQQGRKRAAEIPAASRPLLLSPDLERNLVIWIVIMFCVGRSLKRRHVEQKVCSLLELDGKKFEHVKRSHDWWKGFGKRHPYLSSRISGTLEQKRAANANEWYISEFFRLLAIAYDTVKPKSFINCDESGFNCWDSSSTGKNIGLKGAKDVYAPSSNNREHLTVVATIGIFLSMSLPIVLPLFYIFKGTNVKLDVMDELKDTGSRVAFTKKGWTSAKLFSDYVDWLVALLPQDVRPTLLFVDGHESHFEVATLERAMEHGIYVICFPSHTTHVLQPLDVLVFGSFKTAFGNLLADWLYKHANCEPTRPQIAALIEAAWQKTSNDSARITSAWAAPGLWTADKKFDPEKLARDGKLSASCPTSAAVSIPQLPKVSKKWQPVAKELQDLITSRYKKDPAYQAAQGSKPSRLWILVFADFLVVFAEAKALAVRFITKIKCRC